MEGMRGWHVTPGVGPCVWAAEAGKDSWDAMRKGIRNAMERSRGLAWLRLN